MTATYAMVSRSQLNVLRDWYGSLTKTESHARRLGREALATAIESERAALMQEPLAINIPCVICKRPFPHPVQVDNWAQPRGCLCVDCDAKTRRGIRQPSLERSETKE